MPAKQKLKVLVISVCELAGDGNCLLHAVSTFIWGKPDNSMYLRRVLHSNMSEYSCKTVLRHRWQKQRDWKNTFIPDGGLQYTDEVRR